MTKKNKALISILFTVMIFLTFIYFNEIKNEEILERATLDSTEILIEKVQTDKERALGLSGRQSIGRADGMLFFFDSEGQHRIWMKDMFFSIDIIWIDSSGKVVFIEERISPETFPKVFKSDKPAKFILEVEAGMAEREGWGVGSSFVLESEN